MAGARPVKLDVRVPYVYSLDLNTDPGWPRQGQWQFGAPIGQGGGGGTGNANPTSGVTGANVFGVNLNGNDTNVATKPSSNTDTAFTLSLTAASGLISRVFTHTDGTKPAFEGVIIQKGTQRGAYGYFLTKLPVPTDYTGESGPVSLIGK